MARGNRDADDAADQAAEQARDLGFTETRLEEDDERRQHDRKRGVDDDAKRERLKSA